MPAIPKPVTVKKPHKPLRSRQRKEWEAERASRPRAALKPLTRVVNLARIEVEASPQPKFEYIRSPALLKAIRALPCMHSGVVGRTQAAHSNWAEHGKGKGIKASDVFCAALSAEVHRELDQGKNWTEAERRAIWRAAWVKTIDAVARSGQWPADVPIPDTRYMQ